MEHLKLYLLIFNKYNWHEFFNTFDPSELQEDQLYSVSMVKNS